MPDLKHARRLFDGMRQEVQSLPAELQNPFGIYAPRISIFRAVNPLQDDNFTEASKSSLRLAFVSLPEISGGLKDLDLLGISEEPHSLHDSAQWHRYRAVFHPSASDEKEFAASYKAGIEQSIELKANVICVNELGFPTSNGEPDKGLLKWTWQIAVAKNVAIIAGSCHDIQTLHNCGYLFYPGCPPLGDAFWKQVSACEIGEHVSVPPHRESVSFRAFGWGFCVLICLDIMDYSTVASIAKGWTSNHDLLIVMAYTKDIAFMERMFSSISRALPGCVVGINHDQDLPKYPVSFFLPGHDEPSKLARKKKIKGHAGSITIVNLNKKKLDGIKRRAQKIKDPRMQFLLGRQKLALTERPAARPAVTRPNR